MSDSKNVERILDVMMQQQQQMQQLINVQNKTLELLMNELMGRKTKTVQSDSVESVEEDDRSTQMSNSVKKQDSKKKPSRPCRNCNGMHWDNECPTQRDGKYKKSPKNNQMKDLPVESITIVTTTGKPFFSGKFLINGKEVDMVISTGTKINVIKEQIWRQLGKPKLENPDIKIDAWGREVKTYGFCFANIKDVETGEHAKAKIYVIHGNENVIGLRTLSTFADALDMNAIQYVFPRIKAWEKAQNS